MNIDISESLSSLTNIPKATICSLMEKEALCIAHSILSLEQEDILTADVGIGTISIGKTDDGVRYKFIPSKFLENGVNSSFDGIDPLAKKLEESLAGRIMATYKNMF